MSKFFRMGREWDMQEFKMVSFDGKELRGVNFSCSLPISKNRDWHEPKTGSVAIVKSGGHTAFRVVDDWGEIHVISVPSRMWKKIRQITDAIKINPIQFSIQINSIL